MWVFALGLGSNLGDRHSYLDAAISHLKRDLEITSISKVIETPALLKPNSPKEWNMNYLNMAASGNSALEPEDLLALIKNIERKIGRIYSDKIWAPREIDIDLLLYGDKIINNANFCLPHKNMLERQFVMQPLAEILPDFIHPIEKKTIKELAKLSA